MMTFLLIGFIVLVGISIGSLIIGINEQEGKYMFIALVSFMLAIVLSIIGGAFKPENTKTPSQRYDELTASETLVSNNETNTVDETADAIHDKNSILLKPCKYASLYKVSNEPFYTLKITTDLLNHFKKCRNCYALKRIQRALNEHNVNALHVIHDQGSIQIRSSGVIQLNNHIQ